MDELKRKIENLKISISQDESGKYTASTRSEPFFCFVRDTEDEIKEVVAFALKSYLTCFYDVDDVRVTVKSAPAERTIPRVPLRPLGQLLPNFENLFKSGAQLADARC